MTRLTLRLLRRLLVPALCGAVLLFALWDNRPPELRQYLSLVEPFPAHVLEFQDQASEVVLALNQGRTSESGASIHAQLVLLKRDLARLDSLQPPEAAATYHATLRRVLGASLDLGRKVAEMVRLGTLLNRERARRAQARRQPGRFTKKDAQYVALADRILSLNEQVLVELNRLELLMKQMDAQGEPLGAAPCL